GGDVQLRDQEEPPHYSSSPITDPDTDKIIKFHADAIVKAQEMNANMIQFLDFTGSVGTVRSAMKGDKTGTAIGLAGMVAGPLLSKVFGVGNEALTSGRLLFGEVGGSEVAAQFSRSGGTLTADVVAMFGAKTKGLSTTTKTLFQSIMGYAKQEGLSEVKVQAVAVINKDL